MQKIWAISYADCNYEMSRTLNLLTAKWIGRADHIIPYSPSDLDEEFKKNNRHILEQKRGAGYWIWKPYIILKTFQKMDDGDFCIYTDAGLFYVDKIEKMIQAMAFLGQNIFLSYGIAPCKDWCKRDMFILMDCDCEKARNAIMVSGGYILLRKCSETIAFLEEWQEYLLDARIVSDMPNVCGYPNYPGFRENRHDQSILSLLAWKKGIKPYRAVSCVDQPSTHLNAKKHYFTSYRYSYQKILELIYYEHQQKGYKVSNYRRIFINTRLMDSRIDIFIYELIRIIIRNAKQDIWGALFNSAELEHVRKRMIRNHKRK